MTNRDGTVTLITNNELGRPTASTRLGITQGTKYNALSKPTATWRVGTDGTTNQLATTGYGLGGEVLKTTNAFSGVVSYGYGTNSSGNSMVTITMADGGTRIETRYRDGRLKSVTGTAVAPVRYVYGIEVTTDVETGSYLRPFDQEIKLDASGNDLGEWTKTYRNHLGQTVKMVYADWSYSLNFYNSKGQLEKTLDPDKVATLYQYNGEGQPEFVATDVDQSGLMEFGSSDRVQQTVSDYFTLSSPWAGTVVRRNRSYEYGTLSSTNATLVSESWSSVDGLKSWSIAFGLTNRTETVVNQAAKTRTTTSTAPDNSYTIAIYSSGRLQSNTRYDSVGTQIARNDYTYDAHGRQYQITDARNGTTTLGYNSADAVSTVTSPLPGNGQAAQVSHSLYDTSGRAWKTIAPDGGCVTNEFHWNGALKKTTGSRTYPVEYTYDAQVRMKTLKTWRNFASNTGAAITTWNYHTNRGFLLSKYYADPTTGAAGTLGPDYTYTAGGRLKTRTWARNHAGASRIVTTYKYGFDDTIFGNLHADLTEVSYNDSVTPTITYDYDRRGRQTTIVRAGMTTTRSYTPAGQMLGEANSGGSLSGLWVTNAFNNLLRRTNLTTRSSGTTYVSTAYGYDQASRLQTVTDGTYGATYAYFPNSSLVDTLTFKHGATTRMTTTRQYDFLGRLRSIVNTPTGAGQLPVSSTYDYNSANQRTKNLQADGSYWVYEYDSLGQVTSGKKYWNTDTLVPGQQFEYGFDDIGNRNSTKAGGDANGNSLRTASYTPNALNQYSQRTVPGGMDVLGLATAANAVTVNGSSADYRRGEYFQEAVSVSNTAAAVWQAINVTAGTANTSGNQFVPKTAEIFTYDLDGNTLTDGRWSYAWDGENRLIRMTSITAVGPQQRLDFEYDPQGRRIRKTLWNNTAGSGPAALDLKFLYDGWNLLAELDAANTAVRTYLWGTDLSGTLQGAGGVSGLIAQRTSAGVAQFTGYDGNGNAVLYVDGNTGNPSATFECGPFAETIRVSGTLASATPIRWSTKYTDSETALVYYGFRYYSATQGRWPNRDPIGEKGFRILSNPTPVTRDDERNLYAFVKNQPVSQIDPLGLKIWVCSRKVQGFPFVGNHGYLWDDTGKNPPCGKRGSSCYRQNPNDVSNDKGPGVDDCTAVEDSDGKEDDVMQCCQKKANGGVWLPGLNDCHNLVNRCLKKSGLTPPPHPRFGTPDQSCPAE